nr:pollen-specific leucine-rich repeat extensin-like protein 4 [Globicephala melas]
MIWKRSAVLRFYSVCGLLLQGNPRPAAGSINFMPVPRHPHSTPYFHSPPYSQSPSLWRFPPPPPTPRCGRGQWQFAPAPRIFSAVSTLLSRQSAPYGHLSPFHSPELPTSLTLHHRQHQPPHTHTPTPFGWQLVPSLNITRSHQPPPATSHITILTDPLHLLSPL